MGLRALDLFSGAGGAARGLRDAGFHVVGVDIKPQPRYAGDQHIVADAMAYPLEGFDLIWASPPCQRYSVHCRNMGTADQHPDHLPGIRERLRASGAHWVIENVPGAPMRADLVLCGSMFGLQVIRHRRFECSFAIPSLVPRCQHSGNEVPVYGHGTPSWHRKRHGRNFHLADRAAAMGIDWMSRDELAESIPPAYSDFIGRLAMHALRPANDNGRDHERTDTESAA